MDVTRNQAWRDAEAVASQEPDRLTVIGASDSMLPVYGENTVLVLKKVAYENLVASMNVAYRNDHGAVSCIVSSPRMRAAGGRSD